MRLTRDEYFMSVAIATKLRSTCPRMRVGAVLVVDDRIVSTGYNGAPRGMPHCDDVGCIELDGHCAAVVHAEANALLGVAGTGGVLYTTHAPCLACLKLIINAGVHRVVYNEGYEDTYRDEVLLRWSQVGTGTALIVERIQRRETQ